MIQFIEVVQAIKRNKSFQTEIDLIYNYLNKLSEKERLYALSLLLGIRTKRACSISDLRKWCLEYAEIPEWLFEESREIVGEISETVQLIIPAPKTGFITPTLEKCHSILNSFQNLSQEDKKDGIIDVWKWINPQARRLFNLLVTNSFRFKCNKSALVQAIARLTERDTFTVACQLHSPWSVESTTFTKLFQIEDTKLKNIKPYSFCNPIPLQSDLEKLGLPSEWYADWNWKGERCQLIKNESSVILWSENHLLLNHEFQQIELLKNWSEDTFILDGVLVNLTNESLISIDSNLSSSLKQNRKNVKSNNIFFCAFDILSSSSRDISKQSLAIRREELESLSEIINRDIPDILTVMDKIQFNSWEQLRNIRKNPPFKQTKGIVLRKKSCVLANVNPSEWVMWPSPPIQINGVLLYAHRGTGMGTKRINEYTLGVKLSDEEFIPIVRLPIELNDQELEEIEMYINSNIIERFGPVLSVLPSLIFEITFQELSTNNRRKSGLSLIGIQSINWLQEASIEEVTYLEDLRLKLNDSI